jgi:hypothetical protein
MLKNASEVDDCICSIVEEEWNGRDNIDTITSLRNGRFYSLNNLMGL